MNKKKRNTRRRQIKRTIRGGQMSELTRVNDDIKNIKDVLNNLMGTMVVNELISNDEHNYSRKLLYGN